MLSRKRQTITGKQVVERVKNIKPSKTRKIIRRFHLLISKRKAIVGKLKIKNIGDNDEESNVISIRKQLNGRELKMYNEGFSNDKADEREKQLLKVKVTDDRYELIALLGYIMNEIVNKGGLSNYQSASRVGQDNKRGGDSSKLLVKWLLDDLQLTSIDRVLEIGCLSSQNHISKFKIVNGIERIDLQNINNDKKILKQDFMERPLPKGPEEKFDLISCSLVLNFVNTPLDRGRMLLRFNDFLLDRGYVFIVLPLPCLNNSRYMNSDTFCQLMKHLGFEKLQYTETHKICYMLFQRTMGYSPNCNSVSTFSRKTKLSDKPGMNNFTILLP
ncbi:hypothetical protein TPHA_0M00760 [Tetrapisispora phaffii CBS 4417]|uniref:25S rRNA adenine-N(1) methyltransferase n=1 Tax=Tetrapisispora phaffii (strain ATCC 24235 / CBS 4417 / NBRC 1672 / NRRL Y-8282 / UCD 70-5) TaxID=1071381 RepID=G8C0D6_TETPH|nr:hypothetical protein TPHA_0M00760 [Tetrapisispora phaffii CBS 4417]CCE65651.1 hypothetical protein TPHA_0M00760 [Tetrapisispora phaffii CBS 4417]